MVATWLQSQASDTCFQFATTSIYVPAVRQRAYTVNILCLRSENPTKPHTVLFASSRVTRIINRDFLMRNPKKLMIRFFETLRSCPKKLRKLRRFLERAEYCSRVDSSARTSETSTKLYRAQHSPNSGFSETMVKQRGLLMLSLNKQVETTCSLFQSR